ncbi:MAG: polysaccharide biosynthesis C-terminal domain-containing protein [Thiohalocapsa sp.]
MRNPQLPRLLRGRVAKGAIGTLGLQVTEAGMGFVTALVLARMLGAAEYGAYAFALSFAYVLVIPALLGHNTLAVKETSALMAVEAWGRMRAFLIGARVRVLVSSFLAVVAGLGLLLMLGQALAPSVKAASMLALALVPVNAMLRLHEGIMAGIGRVVVALLPDRAFRPSLFLALTLGAYWVHGDLRSGSTAVALNLSATALGLVLLVAFWLRFRPTEIRGVAVDPAGDKGFGDALPFALMAGLSVINAQADVLMLGFLSTPDAVGVYKVASRVATLVAFALTAVSAPLAPRVAALHAMGKHADIQNLASKAALATTALALPMAALLIIGGRWVLSLFGSEFQQGALVLSVLSTGQFVIAAMGVVSLLLSMTGHQTVVARTLAVTALLNVVLNAALIPQYGASGAAVATTITLFTWSLALAVSVRKRLNINATVFSGIRWLWTTRVLP